MTIRHLGFGSGPVSDPERRVVDRGTGALSGWAVTQDPGGGERTMAHQRIEIELAVEPVAPRLARRSIQGWLESLGCAAERIPDVGLVIAELVTNAVVHA